MPRGRPRKSSTTTATPASTSSRKRLSTTTSTPTRQSKRVKTSDHTSTAKATPKKSQHFHHDDEDKGEEEEEQFSEPESVISKEESGYEDEDESAVPSPSESEDEEDYYSDSEDVKPKKRARSKAQGNHGTMTPKSANGKELWRQGVKAGLGPGNQVVIKKPKAREAGNTPYKEDTIHPNTLLFLKDLKKNNDREWLKMNDPEFRQAERDFKSFIESLTPKMSEADETIPELPFKDIVFRIYRDIRFSPDPTPYKTHFSAAWSRTGRKGPYAAYYVQIAPGNSFVGGGLWMPEAAPLAALRRDIDRKPHRIKAVLTETNMRKEFFGGIGKDEKKAIRAFAGHNSGNALKTKPKGYEADHPNIELLKLKNFTVGKKLADEEVVGSQGLQRVADLVSCMVPFITYLNSVVMPDDPSSGSDDEDEDAEEAENASNNGQGEDEDNNTD